MPSHSLECWSILYRSYCMILFHCEVSHHNTSINVQNCYLAGSTSISWAVTRRSWLQFTSDLLIFKLLLVPSWLLKSYASCLMPCLASWGVVVLALLILCIAFFCLPQLVFCSGHVQPLLCNDFCYACWDSFLCFTCWENMSGFPCLWLAVTD